MRITEFFISGFGIFANENVTGVSPGLNVLLGDNEAGKSTLLNFFRAVFFGFESGASKFNQYKPVAEVAHDAVSVDVPGDVERVEKLLREEK